MKEQIRQIEYLQRLYIEEAQEYLNLINNSNDAEKFLEKREILIKLESLLEKMC